MSKMIQIRNVPNDLHRRLKAQAALEGLSLSDYLLAESLDAPLLTFDRRLAAGRWHRAKVELL